MVDEGGNKLAYARTVMGLRVYSPVEAKEAKLELLSVIQDVVEVQRDINESLSKLGSKSESRESKLRELQKKIVNLRE